MAEPVGTVSGEMHAALDWSASAAQGRQTCQEVLAKLDAVLERLGAGYDAAVGALDRVATNQRALAGRVGADRIGIGEVATFLRTVGDTVIDSAGRGVRFAQRAVGDPGLLVGSPVEVRYLSDKWSRGFEITECIEVDDHEEYRLLRCSDRTAVPGSFRADRLRADKGN
jgi:hypothetical protein